MKDSRFIVGLHSTRIALRYNAKIIQEAWVDSYHNNKRLRELISKLNFYNIPLHLVSKKEISKLVPNIQHQGILLKMGIPKPGNELKLRNLLNNLKTVPLLLVLDRVQDPHNLGACLRTADAAGIHAVIAPKNHSVGLSPIACKVASGAAERLPFIQVTNLARTLQILAEDYNIWIVGTDATSDKTVYDVNFKDATAIVMGGEKNGIRRLTRRYCDLLVSIPMNGSVESLNISVATGIISYEAIRQRNN